jgi:broad specificity phosphatase PhoE
MQRRRVIRTIALGALLLAAACTPQCSCDQPRPKLEKVTVFVVRHAEKQPVADSAPEAERKDPPLSAKGQLRALGLPDDLPVGELDAIYVSNFARTRQTAAAVVAVTGLEPIVYAPKDAAGLAERLLARSGEQVLVVGHSNTIPALLGELGVTDTIEIPEDQYGDLFIVRVEGEGKVVLERGRFGEQALRAEGLR